MVKANVRLLCALALCSSACAPEEPKKYGSKRTQAEQVSLPGPCLQSNTYIIGGREIADSQHPSVAKLQGDGLCTGTFVSPNVFVTAAHCTSSLGRNKTPSPGTFTVKGKKAIKIIQHPLNPLAFRELENNDLAIVVMPDGTSQDYTPILNRDPKISEAVTIVGYGVSSESGGGSGVKREGTNKLASIDNTGKLVIQQSAGAVGASGDSGGPLFIEGKLAGTTVGGGSGTEFYTNLWSTENMTFLRDTVQTEGIKICGLDGYDCATNKDPSTPQTPSSPTQPSQPTEPDC